MHPDRLVDTYGDRLEAAGEGVYDARAAFLQGQFEGYVEDTVLVRGVGYVCWPAATDGRFDAYDELLDAERAALAPLVDEGFDVLADGLSRVVLATPPDAGYNVVKLGRCGMGDGFGDGRLANLVEAALSTGAGPDDPILPSRHCSGRGTYAVYPRVQVDSGPPGTVPATGGPTDFDDVVNEVSRWLSDRAPWLDVDEAVAPENLCIWRGRPRTLDYSHLGDGTGPLGVSDHVDGSAVIGRVDELREAGEKRDLRDGGGFVEPGDR